MERLPLTIDPKSTLYCPTGRPLAEPPISNYEKPAIEQSTPFDARLRKLWAKDIAMGYRWRDQLSENALLTEYWSWTASMSLHVWGTRDDECSGFYKELASELGEEKRSVQRAGKVVKQALKEGIISHRGIWEYLFLDGDGGTT